MDSFLEAASLSSASSSERLVHWNRKPRSRMVWRKGDWRLARVFSSSSFVTAEEEEEDSAISSLVGVSVEARAKGLRLVFIHLWFRDWGEADRGMVIEVKEDEVVGTRRAPARSVDRVKAEQTFVSAALAITVR